MFGLAMWSPDGASSAFNPLGHYAEQHWVKSLDVDEFIRSLDIQKVLFTIDFIWTSYNLFI